MITISRTWNPSQRERQKPILHKRLERLNLELAKEKTKEFDFLFGLHEGIRIRTCVMRDEDGWFYATAQVGDRAFRIKSGLPSGAFYFLTIALKVHIAQLPSAERSRIQMQSRVKGYV